ncbi:MAG TPA: hypothetical protein DDZ38_07320 [Gammaproteobacteria bacterium]|nr:hypothetical protein [Gammaproteobacteria bacterium]
MVRTLSTGSGAGARSQPAAWFRRQGGFLKVEGEPVSQTILPIDLPHQPRLGNFVVGENQELLGRLGELQPGFSGLWLCGDPSSGKSHLLRAAVQQQVLSGTEVSEVGYLRCQTPEQTTSQLLTLVDHMGQNNDLHTVALDDIQHVMGNRAAEEALLTLYQQVVVARGRLLVSHRQPASNTRFLLADLDSRMRALAHYRVVPLDDAGKARVLRLRAEARGYHLPHGVLEYWLSRGPRAMDTLLYDLERLDQASLQHQRMLTIPLLKQVLGY